jgi:3-dehydroquinate dehydratase/shikimate dehydrogenase
MAEVRLDLADPAERPGFDKLPALARVPLILTLRLPPDGGRWGKSGETEKEREAMMVRLLESGGWAYVDLEYDRPLDRVVSAARKAGTAVIRSIHDFSGKLLEHPPARLAGMIRDLAADGYIAKAAALCRGSRQLLTLARAALATESVDKKVLLGMGDFGTPSRILAQRLGSLWTYASVPENGNAPQAAPGQLDPEVLKSLYRFRSIARGTPLFAVAGDPVAQSRSPFIHNSWLKDSGLPGTYLPVRTDDLGALLEICDIWGISGLSVTVPHKERALAISDCSGTLERKIGAANTLLRAGDGWRARNTDAPGFMACLPDALGLADISGLKGLRALIIGAGGAARAAAHALSDAGVKLVILNRSESRARILAGETGGEWGPLSADSYPLIRNGVDIAVQTTSVGMHPNEGQDPIPWWNFEGCSLVFDMIYKPAVTILLARARDAGVNTMNGSAMLEEQARIQFELFTGRPAPVVKESQSAR